MRIVIDLSGIAHRIRRWCWQTIGPWDQRASRCGGCGIGLSSKEREFYGNSCERCEGDWMAQCDGEERKAAS